MLSEKPCWNELLAWSDQREEEDRYLENPDGSPGATEVSTKNGSSSKSYSKNGGVKLIASQQKIRSSVALDRLHTEAKDALG